MTKKAGSGSISQTHGSADPDPHQNAMDPQRCLKYIYTVHFLRNGFWVLPRAVRQHPAVVRPLHAHRAHGRLQQDQATQGSPGRLGVISLGPVFWIRIHPLGFGSMDLDHYRECGSGSMSKEVYQNLPINLISNPDFQKGFFTFVGMFYMTYYFYILDIFSM